jgi:RNA recognition motif-containing protein
MTHLSTPFTKRSSFGFVNFVDHEAAKQACEALDDKEHNGRKLFVGRAQKRSERDEELKRTHEEKRMENEAKSAGVNLYVKNLDGEPADCFWGWLRLMTTRRVG